MFSRSAENYPMCFQGIRNYTCLTTMLQTTHMLSNLLELHMFSHSAENHHMCYQSIWTYTSLTTMLKTILCVIETVATAHV